MVMSRVFQEIILVFTKARLVLINIAIIDIVIYKSITLKLTLVNY